MSTATAIERRFATAQPRLRLRRRKLVQAILEAPDETFHLSSHEMGRRYGVDPATIVRTVQALGYERFADFSTDLRKHFIARITPYTIMKATARERRSVADHIRHSLDHDLENLHTLTAGLDVARVQAVARRIHRSRRVSIIGVDLATSLATFLAYDLQVLGFAAVAPTGSAGNLFHHVKQLTRRDLLIAISFRRGLRDTVEAVLRARAAGVPTVGITDSPITPIATFCDDHLIAPLGGPSFSGSYVAPMALLNAIVVACAHLNARRSLAILRENEEEYNTGPRWFTQSGAAASRGNGSSDRPAQSVPARRRAGR